MDLPLDRNRLHPPYMKQGRLVRNTLSLEQTMVDIFQEIMSFKRQGMWFTYELVGFSHSYMDAASISHIRILGIGLELACNGGSRGGISLKRDFCHTLGIGVELAGSGGLPGGILVKRDLCQLKLKRLLLAYGWRT